MPDSQTNHTPTPWSLDGVEWIDTEAGGYRFRRLSSWDQTIALVQVDEDDEEQQANAEFIVRACNSHQDLMEALRSIADASDGTEIGTSELRALKNRMGDIARAAIAKAAGRDA